MQINESIMKTAFSYKLVYFLTTTSLFLLNLTHSPLVSLVFSLSLKHTNYVPTWCCMAVPSWNTHFLDLCMLLALSPSDLCPNVYLSMRPALNYNLPQPNHWYFLDLISPSNILYSIFNCFTCCISLINSM